MAHIILTGATGLVGFAVLTHALASPAVSRISILSRRPVKLAQDQPKAQVIIHSEFEHYPNNLLEQLKGATACIWAQGITSRGIKEDDYTRITVAHPIAAATAFSGLSDRFAFVHVSGEGADQSERSSMMFGRVKGSAENALLNLQSTHPSLTVYNTRPASIDPKGNYTAERKPHLQDRLATGLGGILETVWKSMVIPTDRLAEALLGLATGDGKPIAPGAGVEAEGRLLRNVALRRLEGM